MCDSFDYEKQRTFRKRGQQRKKEKRDNVDDNEKRKVKKIRKLYLITFMMKKTFKKIG